MDKAEAYARTAHNGQLYGSGGDYADAHLAIVADVAKRLLGDNDNPDIETVAWLHDVLEDTDITFASLAKAFGENIAECVQRLTRDGTEEEYIAKLNSSNSTVKSVKLADILVNLSNLETYRGNALKYALKKSKEIEACIN